MFNTFIITYMIMFLNALYATIQVKLRMYLFKLCKYTPIRDLIKT